MNRSISSHIRHNLKVRITIIRSLVATISSEVNRNNFKIYTHLQYSFRIFDGYTQHSQSSLDFDTGI